MRIEEFDIQELLELEPSGGLVRFAGQRALIFDAVAKGLLRKELIDTWNAGSGTFQSSATRAADSGIADATPAGQSVNQQIR